MKFVIAALVLLCLSSKAASNGLFLADVQTAYGHQLYSKVASLLFLDKRGIGRDHIVLSETVARDKYLISVLKNNDELLSFKINRRQSTRPSEGIEEYAAAIFNKIVANNVGGSQLQH